MPEERFIPAEIVKENKGFCDCQFQWLCHKKGTSGISIGKTLPAVPTIAQNNYPKQIMTLEYAATIPCQQVLGTYMVEFCRKYI